jgi:hypothetical protein
MLPVVSREWGQADARRVFAQLATEGGARSSLNRLAGSTIAAQAGPVSDAGCEHPDKEDMMHRVGWMGWLVAGLLLLQNAATGLAAPTGSNLLEGQLLQHSSGSAYVYHDGLKFAVQIADLGDGPIDAIPTASAAQWEGLFGAVPVLRPVPPSGVPEPFPGYS